MPRTMLTDEYWTRLKPILLKLNTYDKGNFRHTVEGVLYRMHVGFPWRLASLILSIRLISAGLEAMS